MTAAAVVALGSQLLRPVSAFAAGAPVRQVRTAAIVALSDSPSVPTTVEQILLPKGSWTVTSDVTAVNLGQGDFVRCQLLANGSAIDGGQEVYLQGRISGLVDVGTVVAASAVTVSVACDHDSVALAPGQFSVEPGVTLTAVAGGPIRSPGTNPPGSPIVVQNRTTSAIALSKLHYKSMTTVALPKGAWAITANASAYNFSTDFSAFDWVSCRVGGGTGVKMSSNFASAGTNQTDAISTGLDVEAVATVTSTTGTVALQCAADFSTTTSIDSGATITATKTATGVDQVPISQVPLADGAGVASNITQVTMPAGPWRVRSEVNLGYRLPNNSYGGTTDYLRCGLLANGQPIDAGSTELVTATSDSQVVVNAASFTAAAPWTLSLVCSHFAANPSDGTWTVQYGSIVSLEKGPIG